MPFSPNNLCNVSILTGPRAGPTLSEARRCCDPYCHSPSFLFLYLLVFSPVLRFLFYLAIVFPLPPSHSQRQSSTIAMGDLHPRTHIRNDCRLEDENDGEQADFDIDSDVSDADLLELKQELNKLGPAKAQRDLADAIIAAQKRTLQRWKRYILRCSGRTSLYRPLKLTLVFLLCTRYCDVICKAHMKLFKSHSIISFNSNFIWYHNTHPRARWSNIHENA